MEYKENETVTISLQRYQDLVQKSDLKLDELRNLNSGKEAYDVMLEFIRQKGYELLFHVPERIKPSIITKEEAEKYK